WPPRSSQTVAGSKTPRDRSGGCAPLPVLLRARRADVPMPGPGPPHRERALEWGLPPPVPPECRSRGGGGPPTGPREQWAGGEALIARALEGLNGKGERAPELA